jgi:SAM-dependent methyltransferase
MNKCPLCQSTKFNQFFAMPGYKLSRCFDCHLVWDPTPPNNLNAQYEKEYFINENPKGGYANYFQGMQINRKTFRERLKRIEKRLGNKGNLLDVGCALGDCLEEAKKMGWKNIEGVELSKYASGFAKERGLKVTEGTLNNLKAKESFDIVTSQDVIEHIPQPKEELNSINKVLKPGGWILLVTPDVGGWWHKMLGKKWYHYKPGEHIVYFSKETIRKALTDAGFINIETRPTYHFMSLEYIFNRLRYYTPLFNLLLKIIEKTPAKDLPFKIYAGELEAWAQKPTN